MVLTDGQRHVISLVDAFCDQYFSEELIKQWCVDRGIPSRSTKASSGHTCCPSMWAGKIAPSSIG